MCEIVSSKSIKNKIENIMNRILRASGADVKNRMDTKPTLDWDSDIDGLELGSWLCADDRYGKQIGGYKVILSASGSMSITGYMSSRYSMTIDGRLVNTDTLAADQLCKIDRILCSLESICKKDVEIVAKETERIKKAKERALEVKARRQGNFIDGIDF